VEEVVVAAPATAAADPVVLAPARVPPAHERAAGGDNDHGGAVANVRSPWVVAGADVGSPWSGADNCAADVTWGGAVAGSSGSVTRKFLQASCGLSPTLQ